MNNTLVHPSYLHIVTSGIERHIILHGVSSSSPCTSDLDLTEPKVRDLPDETPEEVDNYFRGLTGRYPLVDDDNEQSEEEFDTILLFDQSVISQLKCTLYHTYLLSEFYDKKVNPMSLMYKGMIQIVVKIRTMIIRMNIRIHSYFAYSERTRIIYAFQYLARGIY